MHQPLAARAVSLTLSTALLGALVIAGLSLSYTIARSVDPEAPPVIPVAYEAPPEAPAPKPQETRTPLEEVASFALPQLYTDASAASETLGSPALLGSIALGPVEIEDPHWLRRPSDLERYYPQRALARGVEGEVELDCLVSRGGDLACVVLRETPENWGFGAAAIRIAQEHRMVPATRDGMAVEGRYRMRAPFRLR